MEQYAKKNFYVYNIKDKTTLELNTMVDSTSTYKWINRTDRVVEFDEFITPKQACQAPTVQHWIKDKHKNHKFMFRIPYTCMIKYEKVTQWNVKWVDTSAYSFNAYERIFGAPSIDKIWFEKSEWIQGYF